MDETEAKKWVKNKVNLRRVVAKFFKDHEPVKGKIALFMAGIPGAGKTEFAQNTIGEASSDFIPIEHDKLVEYIKGYTPENYYSYRKAGSTLVTCIFEQCISNSHAFIFDGTLSHVNGIRNIRRTIKSGYTVFVIYIVQDAKIAWELTKARELVRKRSIEKNGFIETCTKINKNLQTIFSEFKADAKFNFWIINKRGFPGMENASVIIHGPGLNQDHAIEKALSKSYNLMDIE